MNNKQHNIFEVWSDELENRLDPFFYQPNFKELFEVLRKSKYQTHKLSEIAVIFSGQRPKGGVRNIESGIPSLGGEHVLASGEIKTEDLKYIPEEFHQKHLDKKVLPNDIILVKDGATTGKVGIIPEDYPFAECNINEHVFAVRITNDNVLPKYLFSVLFSEIGQLQLSKNITGATVTGLTRESVESLLIPMPDDKVQQKIVAIIQKAYEEKRKKEEEIKTILAKIDSFVLSELEISMPERGAERIFEVWSDELQTRFDPIYLRDYKIFSSIKSPFPYSNLEEVLLSAPQYGANERAIEGEAGSVRYVRITDIDEYGNLNDDFKTAEKVEEKYKLKNNDLLFARSGATAGKTFLYKDEFGDAIFAGYLIRFKIDETKVIPDYLFYLTKTKYYTVWKNLIQRPSGQPNINSEEFLSFSFPMADLKTQEKIVAGVKTIYNKVRNLRQETESVVTEAQKQVAKIISTSGIE